MHLGHLLVANAQRWQEDVNYNYISFFYGFENVGHIWGNGNAQLNRIYNLVLQFLYILLSVMLHITPSFNPMFYLTSFIPIRSEILTPSSLAWLACVKAPMVSWEWQHGLSLLPRRTPEALHFFQECFLYPSLFPTPFCSSLPSAHRDMTALRLGPPGVFLCQRTSLLLSSVASY